MSQELPTAVWSGSFTVFGVEVKCHQLSDGRRVIEEDSMRQLFGDLGYGSGIDETEVDELVAWMSGKEPKITTEEEVR